MGVSALRIFISYSREDSELKDALLKQMRVLENAGLVTLWTDDRIRGGDDWQKEIDAALRQADVALLLVSANFLTSKFIEGSELPSLIERRERNGLRIIPVLLRGCYWQAHELLRSLQMLPREGGPVASFAEVDGSRDRELAKIVTEIARLARERVNVGPEKSEPAIKTYASSWSTRPSPIRTATFAARSSSTASGVATFSSTSGGKGSSGSTVPWYTST